MNQIPGRRHDTDTDLLRLLASFAVVVTHTPQAFGLANAFYYAVSRFCVPVFCMISGYYLSSWRGGYGKLFRKIGRLFLLMVAWSGIYYGYELAAGTRAFAGVPALLAYLLTMPPHFWYLYVAMGLYLFTPLLSAFARSADRAAFRYGLGLTFFFGSLVFLTIRSGWAPVLETMVDKMKIDPTLGFFFCYLFGGYARRFGISPRERRALAACGVVSVLLPPAVWFWLRENGREAIDPFYSFFGPNSLLSGAAVFALVKSFCGRHEGMVERLRRPLHLLASCTLGIYLIHKLVLELLTPWFQRALGELSLGVSIPVRAAMVYAVSLAVIFLLQRIPVLRRLTTG